MAVSGTAGSVPTAQTRAQTSHPGFAALVDQALLLMMTLVMREPWADCCTDPGSGWIQRLHCPSCGLLEYSASCRMDYDDSYDVGDGYDGYDATCTGKLECSRLYQMVFWI